MTAIQDLHPREIDDVWGVSHASSNDRNAQLEAELIAKDRQIRALQAESVAKDARIVELERRVAELSDRLGQNSRNSRPRCDGWHHPTRG